MLTTCEQKFSRRGNPWVTERERQELQASLTPARGGAKKAKERVRFIDRKPETRDLTAIELQQKRVRENMLGIRQIVGNHPRDLKPVGPEALCLLRRIYHPMKEEMITFPTQADCDAEKAKHKAFLARERAEMEKRREKR